MGGLRRKIVALPLAGVVAALLMLSLSGGASAIPGGCGGVSYEPPTASFTWAPDPIEAGHPAEFDASSSEPGARLYETGTYPDCVPESEELPITAYKWEFDDGTSDEGETVLHAFASPGEYEVTLTVEDAAPPLHRSDQATYMVTVIDTTPPDTLIDTGPSGTITDTRPVFTFHSTEAESTFQCSIDTGAPIFGPCSGVGQDQPASPLAPGSYTFRVRATDKHGNQDLTPAARTFTVVSQPTESGGSEGPGGPGGTGGSGGTGGAVGTGGAGSSTTGPPDTILSEHPKNSVRARKRASVRFSFSSSAGGATFECQMDRGAFALCTSPKAYRLKPGRHSFSVRAVAGGSEDPTPASFAFKVVRRAGRG